VIVDCFNQHSGDQLRGRTAAIHNMLQPRLSEALGGLPLYLTIGWIELDGTPRVQHGEERIRMFLTEKWAAWHREGVPFHLWLTSPALEVLDFTFALNLGWATSAEDCARRVIYQSLHAPQGKPIYHPTLVGDDFFPQSGAAVSINLAPPAELHPRRFIPQPGKDSRWPDLNRSKATTKRPGPGRERPPSENNFSCHGPSINTGQSPLLRVR
jgi:hypothetical protein